MSKLVGYKNLKATERARLIRAWKAFSAVYLTAAKEEDDTSWTIGQWLSNMPAINDMNIAAHRYVSLLVGLKVVDPYLGAIDYDTLWESHPMNLQAELEDPH